MKTVEFIKGFRDLHTAGDVEAVSDGNRDHLQRMVSRGYAVDPDAPAVESVPAGIEADEPEDNAGPEPPADTPATDGPVLTGQADDGLADTETDFDTPDPAA